MLHLFTDLLRDDLKGQIERSRDLLETCNPEQVSFLQHKCAIQRTNIVLIDKLLDSLHEKERDDDLWTV